MGQTIKLLENALRAWEDLHAIDEALIRVSISNGLMDDASLLGPIRHWRELRDHLLRMQKNEFDVQRFCFAEDQSPISFSAALKPYDLLPLQLASWVMSSRRVFHLSDELVERFLAADYSHYSWSDLLWPFDSFAISFATPVTEDSTEVGAKLTSSKLGLLLVSSIFGVCESHPYASRDGFETRAFCTEFNGKELPEHILDQRERERMEKNLRAKRWVKLNKQAMTHGFRLQPRDVASMAQMFPAGMEAPFSASKGESLRGVNSAAKIIAGLCLYLEALPAGTVESYGWRQSVPQKLPRDVRKVITDGELICQVEDFNVLSPDTITLFPETLRQGPAYAVTPHWRRAHYRRARGQGKNPDAPRTIPVRSALVHKDLLPEGGVPGGAMSSVV